MANDYFRLMTVETEWDSPTTGTDTAQHTLATTYRLMFELAEVQ